MVRRTRGGEGNRKADRRYREGVRKTVKGTSETERAKQARDMTEEELEAAKVAEEKGKSRARK